MQIASGHSAWEKMGFERQVRFDGVEIEVLQKRNCDPVKKLTLQCETPNDDTLLDAH